jgi:hypothetical protein
LSSPRLVPGIFRAIQTLWSIYIFFSLSSIVLLWLEGMTFTAIGALYRDSDNLTFAILAKSFQIPRVMVKLRDPAYATVYKQVGVASVGNMMELFRNKMIMELENLKIRINSNLENRDAQLLVIRQPAAEHPGGSLSVIWHRRRFLQRTVFLPVSSVQKPSK